jgi:hypothetical protein
MRRDHITDMPNLLKFPKLGPAPTGRICTTPDDTETEVLLGRSDQPTNARRDIRDIILCLELAALQLRRAEAAKSDAHQLRTASEYLLMAEELIEVVRWKAPRDGNQDV